jgi:hypothetical protein
MRGACGHRQTPNELIVSRDRPSPVLGRTTTVVHDLLVYDVEVIHADPASGLAPTVSCRAIIIFLLRLWAATFLVPALNTPFDPPTRASCA